MLARREVEQRWTLTQAAAAAEVSVLAPGRVANRTPDDRVQAIACLRRLRFTGPEIAELLGMARIGMGKLGRLGLERTAVTSASAPAN